MYQKLRHCTDTGFETPIFVDHFLKPCYNKGKEAILEKFDFEDEKIKFPQCKEILRTRSKESFLKDLRRINQRIKDFKYGDHDDRNDMRESYIQFISDAEDFAKMFEEIVLDILEAMKYYDSIKEHAAALAKVSRQYDRKNDKMQALLLEKGIDPLDPLATVRQIEEMIQEQVDALQKRRKKLSEVEEEIAITEGVLAKKKSEMELALRSRYTLTESQKKTLIDEKDMILDGIEQWGSVHGALSHNSKITSKPSTIQMYCQMFPEFGQAIEVSKALFKDKIDSLVIERAIEGTDNPVFGKGEYIGNYRIKNDKLLMELAKAKVSEQYAKKAVESKTNNTQNNIQIISFAGVDETKDGFTRDVGVVLDVDENGKVKRIQQEQKMLEYYSKKEGVEIIKPEGEDNDN